MLIDALILPCFWVFVYLFATTVGAVISPVKRGKGIVSDNFFTCFWTGIFMILLVVQLWNLFLPVNIFVWVVLIPFAIWGYKRIAFKELLKSFKKPPVLVWILLAIILIFLVTSTFDDRYIYDTRIYHFTSIRWANSYPLITGIDNLFNFLAYNQDSFLFSAFLNGLWGNNKGACAMNALLVGAVCFEVIFRNARILSSGQKLPVSSCFQLFFLPLCINAGVQDLSSPTPDTIIHLLTFKVVSFLLICTEESESLNFKDGLMLLMLLLLGVVLKLSFAGLAVGAFIVIVYLMIKAKSWERRPFYQTLAIALLMLVPWLIRGVLASGYIGFPASALSFPVDWKIPKRILIANTDFTIGLSRTNDFGKAGKAAAHAPFIKWFPAWFHIAVHVFTFYAPLLICVVSFVALLIKKSVNRNLLLLMVPVFIALYFWLMTAPQFRFATFLLWSAGLMPFAYLVYSFNLKLNKFFGGLIFICSILIMIRNWNHEIEPLGKVPAGRFITYKSRSGLKVNVKDPTDDVWIVGDCKLPCTIFPNPDLILRGKTIREGFRMDTVATK